MASKAVETSYHDLIEPVREEQREVGEDYFRNDFEDQKGYREQTQKLYPSGRFPSERVSSRGISPSGPFNVVEDEEKISRNVEPVVRDAELARVDRGTESPAGRGKRFLAHVKRHWILYTLGFIISTTINFLLLFLVIIPAIIQSQVNSNGLPIITSGLTNPTPTHIDLSLHTQLKTPGPISAHIDAQTLGLYSTKDDTKPFLEFDLPSYRLKGTTDVIVTNQTRPILDQNLFGEFLANSLNTKNFTMYVRGKTIIRLAGFHYNVKINQGIKVPGLNKLSGFGVTSLSLTSAGIVANVMLPNPSPFLLQIGNITQNLYTGTNRVGTGTIHDVLLHPFSNGTFPLTTEIDINAAMQNLTQIIASQAGSISSGKITLEATVNRTDYIGQEIPYWDASMRGLQLTSELELTKVLAALNGSSSGDSTSTTSGSSSGSSTSPLMTALAGLLNGGSSNSTAIQNALQSFWKGVTSAAGNNTNSIITGLLGGGRMSSSTTTTRARHTRHFDGTTDLDDSTVLLG